MKLFFDLIISVTLVVFLSPIMILLVLLILIFQGKSILFSQDRLGKNHKLFKILKFRTMTNEVNSEGVLLPDIERTTKIGNFLRKSSLDELPGLLNVLKGEMSLVGPRPLPTQYLKRYNQEQDRRHLVKPGITGWAQVNGRNAISWEEKFRLDVWYVDNKSFLLDLKILLLTIHKVILRKDIVPLNKGAMEEFLGTKK
jgi:sugar transferase EpsL